MSGLSLLEELKERALERGYTLVGEDFDGGPAFLAPDMFMVRDPAGATYRVSVDNLAA